MAERLAPYAVLLAQVLVFFRSVLFGSDWIIPYDLPGYHEPLATYAARSLTQLRFPLWDNTTYCGFPFYANVQTQLFYPGAWPFFALFGLTGAGHMRDLLEWQVALHIFLGGALMYRLLRGGLAVTAPAAVVGATVFQLGGFFASQAQHLGVVCAGAWLPLLWSSALGQHRRVLAAAAAMTWLAGYPAAALVNVALTLPFGWRTVLKALPITLPLVLCQLAPALELSSLSGAPLRGQYKGTGGGIQLEAFISLLWPNYHRIFHLAEYKLPYNPTYLYLYCGLLPLALTLLARGRWLRLALVSLGVSTLSMMGETTPLWRALHDRLPGSVRSLLLPELAMAGFVASVALLAALGASRFEPRLVWAAVLVAAADLTHAGSNRFWNTGSGAETALVDSHQFEGSAVTLANLRAAVGQTVPPSRIDIANDSMAWASAAMVTGIATANGNDPLCLQRIKDVRLSFAKGIPWMHYYTVDRPLSPILDLVNVRYLVNWEKSPEADLLPLAPYSLPGHQLRENTDVLPRFFLLGQTRRAATREEAVTMLRAPEFDPRGWAIVEDAEAFGDSGADGTVSVIRYLSRRVELETAASAPAFLVSSETWFPGWQASIDGVPAPLVLTNVAFRGLRVPAGKHRVEMVFSPAILWFTLPVSAAAWLWLAVTLMGKKPPA